MSSERGDPEVTVDELLRRVRQDVEQRRLEMQMRDGAPRAIVDDPAALPWRAMGEAIDAATSSATVGMRLPPMSQMRGWKRRLAAPAARLILRVAQLVTRDQSAFNHLVVALVRMLTETVHEQLTVATGQVGALTEGLARALGHGRAIPELVDAGARMSSELRALRERIAGLDATVADAVGRADALLAKSLDEGRHMRTQLLLQERRIAEALEAGPQRAVAAGAVPTALPVETSPLQIPDAFYVGFEDRFRGSRDAIKERVRVYLPFITEAGAGTPARPVLDVGSGRGEWLELLKEQGLVARGVDLNAAMVLESAALGLEVSEGEVLEHLRALPEASVGAVTGMHVLEHVGFPTVVRIFDECTRVLAPGGVAIFETPNPKNLVVGACQFYLDPTHKTPLHPDAMAFVAEARGLTRIRILPLHPVEDVRFQSETDPATARLLKEYLFGPQDFAIVGYRG